MGVAHDDGRGYEAFYQPTGFSLGLKEREARIARETAQHNYNELQKANATIRNLSQRLEQASTAAAQWRERAVRLEKAFKNADAGAGAWRETTRWLCATRAPDLNKDQIQAVFNRYLQKELAGPHTAAGSSSGSR